MTFEYKYEHRFTFSYLRFFILRSNFQVGIVVPTDFSGE